MIEKYKQILNEMKELDVDIIRLYIYDIVRIYKEYKDDTHNDIVEFVYDTWLDIDSDIDLAKLTDVVCENWVAIENDKFSRDDIITEMF